MAYAALTTDDLTGRYPTPALLHRFALRRSAILNGKPELTI